MIVNELRNVKADGFTVFASLPDIGSLGGLVSSFLSEHLKQEKLADNVERQTVGLAF